MMLAAREKPDLITLDFQMPAGDGAKLFERLRANSFTANTPIIFVTGTSRHDLESSLQKDAKVRFLQKPIDMAVLKRFIADLLGGQPQKNEATHPSQGLGWGSFGDGATDADAP
jgi:putative two-component system response regulator